MCNVCLNNKIPAFLKSKEKVSQTRDANISEGFYLPMAEQNSSTPCAWSKYIRKGRDAHEKAQLTYYKIGGSQGINSKTTKDTEDIFLARNAHRVAEHMQTFTYCYTGFKHALLDAGVINNYSEMPQGGAAQSLEYFEAHPEKFEKILNNGKKLTTEELKKLPAGHIVVYSYPEKGLFGHAAITTGNGQGMSDTFDNMEWVKEKGGGGATFDVFKLTDGWKYNPNTKKLEFAAKY